MRVAFVNNGGSFFNGFWRGALASGLAASFSGAIAGAMPGLGGSILAGSFGGFSGGGFSTLLNGGEGYSPDAGMDELAFVAVPADLRVVARGDDPLIFAQQITRR